MAAIADRLTILILAMAALSTAAPPVRAAEAYGMQTRIVPRAWLNMPQRSDGVLPKLLSKTGAFADTRRLIPAPGLIPYDLVVSFWSDGASKQRWVAVPAAKIAFSPTGEWRFPPEIGRAHV